MVNTKMITPSILKKKKFSKSTFRISKRKRDIGIVLHSAWENYEKELYYFLTNLSKKEFKSKEFDRVLMKTREIILRIFNHSRFLQEINLFLYKLIQNIRKLIEKISFKSAFVIEDFIINYYGGIPHFEEHIEIEYDGILIKGRIDQLIITQEDQIIIKDLKPDFIKDIDIDENPSLFQLLIYAYLAEIALSKQCEKLILINYEFQTQEIIFNNILRSKISEQIQILLNQTPNLRKSNSPFDNRENKGILNDSYQNKVGIKHVDNKSKEKNRGDYSKTIDASKIGWCVAKRSKKPTLSVREPNKIKGYINDSQKLRITSGLYIVIDFFDNSIENNLKIGNVRIIARITNIKPYTDSISLIKNSTSENIIEVELEPIYEISEGDSYIGKVRPHIFDNAGIRFCNVDEIVEFLKIPKKGFELGEIEDYGNQLVKYRLPYNKLSESICILGTQGTGKTTLIHGMTSKFIADFNLISENRPSVIILDIESEYNNLGTETFQISNEGFLESYNIAKDIKIQRFKIGYSKNDFTLDLSQLEPEEYVYFIPDLTSRTSEAFISIAKKVKENLSQKKLFSKNNLLSGIINYIKSGKVSYLHNSTINAILRACDARYFDLFDFPGCKKIQIEDLKRPGTLSIINIFELPDQEQRITALYFILAIYRSKMKSSKIDENTLALVIDEAHRIFPRLSTLTAEKDYIDRIVSKVNEITHRGRKRNYGIIFATQNPRDLKKEIITTCNTKILFRIAGETSILNELVERHILKEIQYLPVGVGFITCQGIHKSIKIRFPHLNIK